MDKQEANYLLGKLNGQHDSLKEGIERIEKCLKPLGKKVYQNENAITKIIAIGATMGGLITTGLIGLRIWIGWKE